jgi:hypothetical protein
MCRVKFYHHIASESARFGKHYAESYWTRQSAALAGAPAPDGLFASGGGTVRPQRACMGFLGPQDARTHREAVADMRYAADGDSAFELSKWSAFSHSQAAVLTSSARNTSSVVSLAIRKHSSA